MDNATGTDAKVREMEYFFRGCNDFCIFQRIFMIMLYLCKGSIFKIDFSNAFRLHVSTWNKLVNN